MREVIAKRIIETAQQGVKDQLTLVDDAVRFLPANWGRWQTASLDAGVTLCGLIPLLNHAVPWK
jgi:hypothetical protein